MKLQGLYLALPLLFGSSAYLGDTEQEALEFGREQCQLFYDQELQALWDRLSEDMRTALGGSVEGLGRTHAALVSQVGEETELVSEKVLELPGGWAYKRQAHFSKLDDPLEFLWQFDQDRTILAFLLTPVAKEAESRFLDYRTKTELRLPFDEPWHVFWGGRTLDENYHTAYPDQRFAYDLLIFRDGKTHAGEGKRNEDYYCFGKPLVSPGKGVVVSSAKDVKDNVPGRMNANQALGNHVIIDHENGEFSFLAHFKQGSLLVETGDRVEAGTPLGLAGNSGNTSEPHLHYHLQNTPTFNDGEGLPSQFLNYLSDGKLVRRGEPSKGQVLEHAGPAPGR